MEIRAMAHCLDPISQLQRSTPIGALQKSENFTENLYRRRNIQAAQRTKPRRL
jgi:hypothetical protein